MGILTETSFDIHSTQHRLKGYTQGQLIFSRDMIIPIKYSAYWESICQQKQAHINKGNNRKNIKIVHYSYKLGYKLLIRNKKAYKYEPPYTGP